MVITDMWYGDPFAPLPTSLPLPIYIVLTSGCVGVGLGWLLCMYFLTDWRACVPFLRKVWPFCQQRDPRPESHRALVEARFEQRRQRRFVTFMETGCFCIVPLICAFIFVAVNSKGPQDTVVATAMRLVGLFCSVIFMCFASFRDRFTTRSTHLVFAAMYLAVSLPAPFSLVITNYYYDNCASLLTLMYLSSVYPSRRLAWLLNGVGLTWHCAAIFASPALRVDIVANLFLVSLGYLYSGSISTSSASVMWAEAEAQINEEAKGTVEGLLQSTCDAVVALKADLSFWEPSKSLQLLLGLREDDCPEFMDLLHEADKERFVEFVSQSSEEASAAHVIHIDMVPPCPCHKELFAIKIFHTCSKDLVEPGLVKHLLGLVEEDPTQKAAPEPQPPTDTITSGVAPRDGDEGEGEYPLLQWNTTSEEGNEVTLTVRTRLQLEILDGPETNRFGFGKDDEPLVFLNRFRRSKWILRWFEFVHSMASCGFKTHDRFELGKVGFMNTAMDEEFRGRMRAEILQAPTPSASDGDTEAYGPWELLHIDDQYVDIQICIRPPAEAPTIRQSSSEAPTHDWRQL